MLTNGARPQPASWLAARATTQITKAKRAFDRERTSISPCGRLLHCPGLPKPQPRHHRPSLLDSFKERLQARLAEGVFNCEVLEREVVALGYRGEKTILKDYGKPFRAPRPPRATMR